MFLMNQEAAASITCTSTALTLAFVFGHPPASKQLPPRSQTTPAAIQPRHPPAAPRSPVGRRCDGWSGRRMEQPLARLGEEQIKPR